MNRRGDVRGITGLNWRGTMNTTDLPESFENPQQYVAAFFPLDGPYSASNSVNAAAAAAELLRYLNHATRSSAALPTAQDVDALTRTVAAVLWKLPQLLDQIANRLRVQAEDPRMAADDMGQRIDPAAEARAAADALAGFGAALETRLPPLDRAIQPLARLYFAGDVDAAEA